MAGGIRLNYSVNDTKLRNTLRRMGKDAVDILAQGLDFGADIVLNDAQRRVRRRTGNLAQSLAKKIRRMRSSGSAFASVGTDLEYAPFLEFGTGIYAEKGDGRKTPWAYTDAAGEVHWTWGSRPHPYLRPAFDENVEAIQREVVAAIRQLVERS